ncbi:ABH15 protein, partial [Amia calva]|nr:ABH15 protein [Amia calva]
MEESVVVLLPGLALLFLGLLLRLFRLRVAAAVGRLGAVIWRQLGARLHFPLDHSERPQLISKPSALARYLLQHCGSLARPSLVPWPWSDPHIQTLHSQAWPVGDSSGEVSFARDLLELRDGGVVALDWAVATPRDRGKPRAPSATPSILIVVPNCWGGLTLHVLRLCRLALAQGFYPVVFHRRGQGGCPLVTPALQQFGDPADLIEAVSYIRCRHPSSALVAVSEGSGAGLLLSYLGECGSSSYLKAAVCLSPIFHGQLWFETPLPPPYRWALLIYQKLQLSRYATTLSSVMDVEAALRCSSLRDFEEALFCSKGTGKAGGTEQPAPLDWEGYWEKNEPLRDVDEVAVPVLCLSSWDDPLRGDPRTSLPFDLFRSSPYFLLALTGCGGHCGLGAGGRGEPCWSHAATLEYFRVVGEFLRAEERGGLGGGGLLPRRRTSTQLPRRRRGTVLRRDRITPTTAPPTDQPDLPDLFQWHRSYTR